MSRDFESWNSDLLDGPLGAWGSTYSVTQSGWASKSTWSIFDCWRSRFVRPQIPPFFERVH